MGNNFLQILLEEFCGKIFPERISCKNFPTRFSREDFVAKFPTIFCSQNFAGRFSTTFPARLWEKLVPQGFSHNNFLQHFLQDCGEPATFSCKFFPRESFSGKNSCVTTTFPASKFSHKKCSRGTIFQEHFLQDNFVGKCFPTRFSTRISCKNSCWKIFPQDFPARISCLQIIAWKILWIFLKILQHFLQENSSRKNFAGRILWDFPKYFGKSFSHKNFPQDCPHNNVCRKDVSGQDLVGRILREDCCGITTSWEYIAGNIILQEFPARLCPVRSSHRKSCGKISLRDKFLQEDVAGRFSTRISCKIFPQQFPARFQATLFLQDFPTRISCKIVGQNSSSKNFPQDFAQKNFLWVFPTTILPEHFLQDVPTRISHKIVQDLPTSLSWDNSPAGFSHKIFPQEFPTRFPATFSFNIILQVFPTTISCNISCKFFPQQFPATFPARFSRKYCRKSCGKFLWENLAGNVVENSCGKILQEMLQGIVVGKTCRKCCRKLLWEKLKMLQEMFWENLVGKYCGKLLWEKLVGKYCRKIIAGKTCR